MSTHTTITDEQIRRAAERTGATTLSVKKVILGLPDDDRAKILGALQDAGVDARFLRELNSASGGRRAWLAEDGEILPTKQGNRVRNAGGSR